MPSKKGRGAVYLPPADQRIGGSAGLVETLTPSWPPSPKGEATVASAAVVQRPVVAVPILSPDRPPASIGASVTVTTSSEAPCSVAEGRSKPATETPGSLLQVSSADSSAVMVSGRDWVTLE